MGRKFILSIDQGTTGSTVSLVNKKGQIVFSVNHEFPQIYPKPGWVEHNPEDIWKSVTKGIAQLVKKMKIQKNEIASVGVTNQRETVVAWDRKTGRPFYNGIVWQCRRTSERCLKLKKKRGFSAQVKKQTGLVLDPYFSATKMEWLLKNNKEIQKAAKEGRLCFGTIDSFIIMKLTGVNYFLTDPSNASRTLLFNIHKNEWSSQLLKEFSLSREFLPEVRPSDDFFAETNSVPGLQDGIPVHGVLGDQQAALFGQSGFSAGDIKCTFGTGSFILMNSGYEPQFSKDGLLTTVAWGLKKDKKLTYALEGGAFICGAAVQWLRDEMGLIKKSSDIEALAQSVEDSMGVTFVPAFTGLGAPHWKPEARGVLWGLTRGTSKAHIARAVLDAMAWQNVEIMKSMEMASGKNLKQVKVDGGATANNLLLQLQADYLGKTVVRPKNIESTVLGAAYVAGLGAGFWKSKKELKSLWQVDQKFSPRIKAAKRKQLLSSWHQVVRKA